MKLASLRTKPTTKDGIPCLISHDAKRGVRIDDITPSARDAVENWSQVLPALTRRHQELSKGEAAKEFAVNTQDFHSPLPRAFQWADGSAFIHHIKLVRKARGAALPETLLTVPLMYQGGSDSFLAPTDPIPLRSEKYGLDFESEVAVVTDFVPMGVTPDEALKHILLVMIVNDVSLRGLIPEELAQGFGFLQSKPSSAFAPFALTPDELGSAWQRGRVHLPLHTYLNGQVFGKPNAKEMHFHFGQLISHAARTRDLAAGTIIGSGTVSNEDPSAGSSCLVERRMIEKIETGEFKTSFMKVGDSVRIEMLDASGRNLFGTIEQTVVAGKPDNY